LEKAGLAPAFLLAPPMQHARAATRLPTKR
jgi:hypothetical protein